jgi:hypothetical protein
MFSLFKFYRSIHDKLSYRRVIPVAISAIEHAYEKFTLTDHLSCRI